MLNLSIFIPTFFFVSITPGLCMTLAMVLGITIGYRRSLWMMFGELIGVGIVASASALSVAAIMINNPSIFTIIKVLGGLYLFYIGISMWLKSSPLRIQVDSKPNIKPTTLAIQGFITAISNPKGWAFFVSLLPPFIREDSPVAPQLIILISIILLLEFICLSLYSLGGSALRRLLVTKEDYLIILNRIAGTFMIMIALWMVILE